MVCIEIIAIAVASQSKEPAEAALRLSKMAAAIARSHYGEVTVILLGRRTVAAAVSTLANHGVHGVLTRVSFIATDGPRGDLGRGWELVCAFPKKAGGGLDKFRLYHTTDGAKFSRSKL